MDEPTTGPSPARTPLPASQPTWSQLDTYAEQLRVMLPAAPPGLADGYMRFVPWVAIVFGILWVLISLVALVGSTFFGFLAVIVGSPGTGFGLVVGSVFALAGGVLDLIGGWLMLQRKATGWWLLAVGLVIGLLTNLVRVSVLGLIVLLAVAYVHLQVKPNYK